jgi:TRAP-type C4-dicarboxylate transport system substrate-binding protein
MSKNFFDSFDKPSQDILLTAAKESAEYVRKWGAAQMAEQLKAVQAGGMEITTDVDTKAFQEAVKPVYDKYGPRFGAWLKEIEDAKKK